MTVDWSLGGLAWIFRLEIGLRRMDRKQKQTDRVKMSLIELVIAAKKQIYAVARTLIIKTHGIS